MAQKEPESVQQLTDGIDQIRDIIFGEQISEYDKKLSNIEHKLTAITNDLKNLEKKHAETANTVNENLNSLKNATSIDRDKIHEMIEQMKNEIDQKMNELGDSKVDKSAIGEVFIEWGMKVKQAHVK